MYAFQSGFTPNVFGAMSYRPDEFRAFFMYYDAVMNDRPGGNYLNKACIIGTKL